MPTTERAASGGYLKYQDPGVWAFVNRVLGSSGHSALRAFPGPRENPGGRGMGIAVTCDVSECACTPEVWVWDYACIEADDDTNVIAPTDQPRGSGGTLEPGRWLKLSTSTPD